MKKILFPTDFSENANNAFVYALKWAEKYEAEIITLHVYELPVLDMSFVDIPLYQAEVYQSIEMGSFENFKDQIPILRNIASQHGLSHIPLNNILLSGDLVSNILEIVQKEYIDFVIMGTTGSNGFKGMFLGSNTASVMSGTNTYVIGIPEKTIYQPITKIAFTTQFTIEELDSLRRLIPIAKKFDAEIECVYIKNETNAVKEIIIADWEVIFREENVRFHIIESNDVQESILEFINEHHINLLTISKHKRGFWEGLFHSSLTEKLSNNVQIPLLVLHDH